MNKEMERARARYKNVELPEELSFAVASAIRAGDRKRESARILRRSMAAIASCCACFILLVNASPAFAQAIDTVPLLGDLARLVTVREYTVEDKDHLIDVRLPALENTGHTDLEQRINTEISTRIQAVLEEAEARAQSDREAYLATGGTEEDFIPIIIDIDYELKCQSTEYLSFILMKTETKASAYTEYFTYNIDLETGREVSLRDLLGPNWKSVANEAVQAGIAERSKDPDLFYFNGNEGVEGFQSIRDDQPFYLNAQGNPVIVFEKYEIAPGYMGMQEFEIRP